VYDHKSNIQSYLAHFDQAQSFNVMFYNTGFSFVGNIQARSSSCGGYY